ncbi:MAG TPA: hypothetical protein VN033_07650 [Vulgatibacter sp.]|nr:hypothetical protein [Vulgatibacter sp.]
MRSHGRRTGLESLHAVGHRVAGALVLGLAATGCGDDGSRLGDVQEPFRVVSGVPAAEDAQPRIERSDREARPDDFRAQRSSHCDTFQQRASGKVDVLLAIRSSPSMEGTIARLAGGLDAIFGVFDSATPAIDFHFAITTTSPEPLLAGSPRFVSCRPVSGVTSCDVGAGTIADAIAWAGETLRTLPLEHGPGKGLLAASRIASRPEASGGFLRSDAELRVIFVSDEDDASCLPFAPPGAAACTSTGVCGCGDLLDFGSTDYFARVFSGAKGFANGAAVAADAIVATTAAELDRDDGSGFAYVGCTRDPSLSCDEGDACALHAPRYAGVADSTGGRVIDLCDADLGVALREIGWAASGLAREFRLSRVPIEATIETVVVPNDPVSCDDASPCSDPAQLCVRNRCVLPIAPDPVDGWEHQLCSGSDPRNVIRFNGRSIPSKLETIEVCYDVDVGSELSLCR